MNNLVVKTNWIPLAHCVQRKWLLKFYVKLSTGGPSSSCKMIILRNNSHGGIIRVCMGIFTTALRNKKIRQILKKNTSPRFHSVLLVIWPLVVNWNETTVCVLGFCVGFVAARSFWAWIFRFSDQAFGNGVFSLGLFLCTLKTSKWTTR